MYAHVLFLFSFFFSFSGLRACRLSNDALCRDLLRHHRTIKLVLLIILLMTV